MNTNIHNEISSQKGLYGLLAILCHFPLPFLIAFAVGHAVNSSVGFWITIIILFPISMSLFQKSFHETKANIIALAFAFGKCICVLREGTSYVPFGFLKGAVQEYTTAELSFEETITVEKMKTLDDKELKKGKYAFDTNRALEYLLKIRLTGSFKIVNAYRFFKETGLETFKDKSLEKGKHPFFKILMGDLESDFDFIAQSKGYSEFRQITDWTVEKIIALSSQSNNGVSSFKDRLDSFGLSFKKVATNTKFDEATEKILTDQLRADAERGPAIARANYAKEVAMVNAEAEAYAIEQRGKASAAAEKSQIQMRTNMFNEVFEDMSVKKGIDRDKAAHLASLVAEFYGEEKILSISGPDGKQLGNEMFGMLLTLGEQLTKMSPSQRKAVKNSRTK